MAQLILKLKDREIKRINLSKTETTIGRDPDCDMFIDNIGVSRNHSKIVYQGGRFLLRDNGSSNGTFLNGNQVDEADINDGDEVQLGKYKVVFSTAGGMPEHLIQADAAPAEDPNKKARNVFGTVQFSPDEIQNLMAAKKEGNKPVGAAPTPRIGQPTRDFDDDAPAKSNQLNIILGVVVALLIIVLVVVLVTR